MARCDVGAALIEYAQAAFACSWSVAFDGLSLYGLRCVALRFSVAIGLFHCRRCSGVDATCGVAQYQQGILQFMRMFQRFVVQELQDFSTGYAP